MSTEASKTKEPVPSFRVAPELHQKLKNPEVMQPLPEPDGPVEGGLPEPVYPQYTEARWTTERRFNNFKAWRSWKGLGAPYFRSRILSGRLRPLISYLFTEWKCNLDCNYCWSYENSVQGMTEPTAKQSIDWLHSIGNRFLALMGGEPLLRPKFIHKVVHYAARKDFIVYLPTNGRLMRPDVIDRLGDAGLGTVNLAVDAMDLKPGLHKALAPIRPYFDYLLGNQRRYGYSVFLNVCITRNNMDDVRQLTELAREHDIGIDFHIVESPMLDAPHFKHLQDNPTFLREEDLPRVDELIDWLIEKHEQGYKIVNQKARLAQMKEFMRGDIEPWGCKAGENTLIVRTDGTLAPCFPMYSATYDWGRAGSPKFDRNQLNEMKKECELHCFSTLNHILSYVYNNGRVVKWILHQARNGFTKVDGTIE